MNKKYEKDTGNSTLFFPVAVFFGLLLAFAFLLCTAGCGKKAPPLPPLNDMISCPANLSYSFTKGRIALQWTYSRKNNTGIKCRGFKIFRAQRLLSGNTCKGCPLHFIEIDAVSPTQLHYSERIKRGYEYFYRIRAYSQSDVLSDVSNTIEVSYK